MTDEEIRLKAAEMATQVFCQVPCWKVGAFKKNVEYIFNYIKFGTLGDNDIAANRRDSPPHPIPPIKKWWQW